uniref:NADH-ubiquinone oxidoreductase chain 1 n=1 Tax=Valvata hokkaidoensis TaxID=96458 RepID=A0A7R7YCE4_9GAST|nr:ND1 [Valvata hokkaidoensis]
MINLLSMIMTYVCILLAMAFYTLLERKGLSYMQTRKGPNKVGIMGILQPFADAMKLFLKENMSPSGANSYIFFLAPGLALFIALLLWRTYPSDSATKYLKYGILFFMCVTALNVYSTLLAGWSSNSKYAFLGALRAAAQTISYEVSMILILLFPIFMTSSMSFDTFSMTKYWLLFLFSPVFFMWICSIVAETNRAPFDFAEGESEIVSGFNIEYGAAGFAMLFMAEYMNILVMSMITTVTFLGASNILFYNSSMIFTMKILLVSFIFIWTRVAYPRFRYDLLMTLTWKSFLPVILASLCLILLIL